MALSTARVSGSFDREQVVAFLDEAVIPLRLACVAPSGWPLVVSLWFVRRGDELVCATQRSSSLVRALEHDQRCAFEVAGETPPYRGVRGRARVAIDPDDGLATLAELLWAMRKVPDARASAVTRGRRLLSDPDYPSRDVLRRVARVLAKHLKKPVQD